MRTLFFAAAALACTAAVHADVYTDATGDMFSTAPSNLDISSVSVTSDATTLYISVTTVTFDTWTKYMIFMKTGAGSSTSSNAWNRPVDFSGQTINHFIGSWVDQPTNNSQNVAWDGANWDWGGSSTFTNSVSGNTVTWAVSLASLGLGQGDKLLFDVATSGNGGGDSGIDHLSRSDPATGWWTDTSYSGQFLSYTVPGPGALALLGVAGMVGRRRRQA